MAPSTPPHRRSHPSPTSPGPQAVGAVPAGLRWLAVASVFLAATAAATSPARAQETEGGEVGAGGEAATAAEESEASAGSADAGDAEGADAEPSAPPTPDEIAAAREAFSRGQQAFNGGDYQAAADAYEEAYAIVPDPTILFSLGDARQRAEDYVAAAEAYEKYLEKRPDADNREDVETRLEQLRQVPGSIKVTTDPPGASITVDDEPTGETTPATVSVSPGAHLVSVSLPRYAPAFEEVEVEFARETEVSLTLEEAPEEEVDPEGATGAAVGAGGVDGGEGEEDGYRPSVGLWVAIGVASAGLAAGTVLGFLAMDRQGEFDDTPGLDIRDEGESLALGADIALGVGLAAGVTAVVLYVVEKDAQTAQRSEGAPADDAASATRRTWVTPTAGPHGGGLVVGTEF